MKGLLKRIWFPLALVFAIAAQTLGTGVRRDGDPGYGFVAAQSPDTIKYRNQFLSGLPSTRDDSLLLVPIVDDSLPVITARDTIVVPDSLRETDPFRYKYYVAIIDSLTHRIVRDSLVAAGDSLDWPRLDSLYAIDSAFKKKEAFDKWYDGLSKTERKKYDFEVKSNKKKHVADSVLAVKDSVKSIRDSVKENTPRILETFALPDSMQYKRIVEWTRDRDFHKIKAQEPDTGFNYRFYDYPIFRKDVNATWLGTAGSATQSYDFFKRESQNGVSFYDPYESWTFSPSTAPMYNTKTPYTELGYFGTLFANTEKASDNLHIMTTQNIWPEFNFTLEYDRFGGNGMLENEKTTNKTFAATTNYLGKRYMMHAGYLFNKISRGENGGISDKSMVRDTTLDAREYPVYLKDASSLVRKNTVFLDQQYRIPFTFLKNLKYSKTLKAERAYRDSALASGDSLAIVKMKESLRAREAERAAADSTGDEDITSAFIGHSSEYSVFTRTYQDNIGADDESGRDFYGNNFFYNPTSSYDSLRVMKLENKIFIRLQPWSSEGIVSKLNAGIGDRILTHYKPDPSFLSKGKNVTWNSAFLYAGVEGQFKDYIQWDASGDYSFAGKEANDFGLEANARFSFYPFRRARRSPVSLDVHFETRLDEPDFYTQEYYSNHYRWSNDFEKISTTKIRGVLSIPRWNLSVEGGYALLSNNIYMDSTGVVRQNGSPMSVVSASVTKNFSFLNDHVHLDNKILFGLSSNQAVLPLPTAAINARYYFQFNVKKNIMKMQVGANAWMNTKYHSPGWNPAVGAFYNQRKEKYYNGPYIDAFVNVQWKRACIFIKFENVGLGWPMDKADYFSAHDYIRTQRSVKFGIYWPFYLQPGGNKAVSASGGLSGGSSGRSGSGSSFGGFGGGGGLSGGGLR